MQAASCKLQAASSPATPPGNLKLFWSYPITLFCAAKCHLFAALPRNCHHALLSSRKPLLHWAGAQALDLPLPAADHPKMSRRCPSESGNQSLPLPTKRWLAGAASTVKIGCFNALRDLSCTKCPASQETFGVPTHRVVSSALELGDDGRG